MTTDANRTAAPAMTPEERAARKRERTEAVRARFQHDLGISYGPHPKQVLDVYRPGAAAAAPVLIFIHGGGFLRGDPASEGYLGGPLLERGGVYVTLGYRLAPEARYPQAADDIEHGLRWIADHIGEHGGDPSRLYLSGTSAGATLAAAVTLRAWVAEPGLSPDLIKGLVLFSGPYDQSIANEQIVDAAAPRFVPDLTQAIERVPARTILVSTDEDMPWAAGNADAMAAALRARGGQVERYVQVGADHFNAPRSLADGEGEVFEAVARMMALG